MAERAIDLDVAELAKFKGNLLPALGPLAVCLHAKSTVFLGNDIRELGNRSVSIETESLVSVPPPQGGRSLLRVPSPPTGREKPPACPLFPHRKGGAFCVSPLPPQGGRSLLRATNDDEDEH